MLLSLNPQFYVEDWAAMESSINPKIVQGQVHWDIDIGRLRTLDSRLIGLFIGLNTILDARGGSLQLIVPQNSIAARTLSFARIDQIMSIILR